MGNAWMMCGVLYATDTHDSSPTTINYAFDTSDGTDWDPGISFENPNRYNTAINYNPVDGMLRAWDSMHRLTYTTTVVR